jgi:hypothetical protein
VPRTKLRRAFDRAALVTIVVIPILLLIIAAIAGI